MTRPIVIPGTPGLTLAGVAHIVVPGGGRDQARTGLSTTSMERIRFAYDLFRRFGWNEAGGRIVCSGYKSPADANGAAWSPAGSDEVFQGIPEADAMRQTLLDLGCEEDAVVVERHSIDTTTNFARVEREGCFPDGRPVAIVSHEEHLRRIIEIIAPRTLRRGFLGVVVQPDEGGSIGGQLPRLASRLILRRVTADRPDIVAVTTARAVRMWSAANRIRRLLPGLNEYYQGG